MALKIKEENGTYFVSGYLNANTSYDFFNHFEDVLNAEGRLEINIECLNHLDNNGLLALYKLYKKAQVLRQGFAITGKGSDVVSVELGFVAAA